MKLLKADLRSIPKLLVGLIFVALGLLFSKKSDLGMLPWGVFHSGLANVTGLTFGQVVQGVGLIILVLSIIFVKIEPGIGTFLNVILIGWFYDVFDALNLVEPHSGQFHEGLNQIFSMLNLTGGNDLAVRISYLIIGIIITGFGRALYISCKLGAGPRDGIFVGITQMTGLSVKYSKPIIEVLVVIIGILMKGDFGFGTIINALISGYVLHFYFKVLNFDPKSRKHRSLRAYFKHKLVVEE